MTFQHQVISTESYTQSRRLLERFEKLAPEVKSFLHILLDLPPGPKRAQFDGMVEKFRRRVGGGLVYAGVSSGTKGRQHSMHAIVIGGRGASIGVLMPDALHLDLHSIFTGRADQTVTGTFGAVSVSRHAIGRFLERRGFRAGEDEGAAIALHKSFQAIAAESRSFRALVADATLDAKTADELPLIEGFVRDGDGVWVLSGMSGQTIAAKRAVRGVDMLVAFEGAALVRTYLSSDFMSDATVARIARYEKIMADGGMLVAEKAEALRLRDDDRIGAACRRIYRSEQD